MKDKVANIIGAENAYVFDSYINNPDNNEFIEQFLTFEASRKDLKREAKPSYAKIRKRYLAKAIQRHFNSNLPSRSIASIDTKSTGRLKFKTPQ
jgi:hypothetical protein